MGENGSRLSINYAPGSAGGEDLFDRGRDRAIQLVILKRSLLLYYHYTGAVRSPS